MKLALFSLLVLALFVTYLSQFQAHAASSGPLTKHLSSLVKWTRASSKTPHQPDGYVLQFEDGYLVETVVEGNELGVVPYSIRVSQDGELFAVDFVNSNIVRITPPLSQYSRARLVAGSFKGHAGHVDGKPTDARFNHPKGVTMDDKGNIYVADTANLAIRKIGEAGVTTIAGGKSNIVGYRDGPSEDAKFSSDFDVIYVRSTCSLLVIDRGNAALRQISLNKEDCGYENRSVTATDLLMVVGAILSGYALCKLQQGFGSSFFSKTKGNSGTKLEKLETTNEILPPVNATVKNENEAGWPSFEQLIWDLSKLVLESLGGIFSQFIPSRFRGNGTKRGLTPVKDSLVMPEDETEPSATRKQRTPTPLSETRHTSAPTPVEPSATRKQRTPTPLSETRHTSAPMLVETFSDTKPTKHRSKDPSLSSKHRSSRRQEFAEFYGSGEVPQYPQVRSKSQKERTKHRSRDKTGDAAFGAPVMDSKPAESKDTKFDPYNFRSKYGDSFRF